jgi:hypothetical protein
MAFTTDRTDYWASFVCFPTQNKVPFLPASALRETRFAFLLIIELKFRGKWFLGVYRTGVLGVDELLEDSCVPIGRQALTRAFGSNARYEKLSFRRMTVSSHELRSSSYEAADLEIALPTLAVTRSVPRHLRLQSEDHGNISITPGTGRVHKSGPRAIVNDLAILVRDVAREALRNGQSSFLDAFPTSVDFDEKPASLRPTGVLLDWSGLLNDTGIELRSDDNDTPVTVIVEDFLSALGGVLTTEADDEGWVLRSGSGAPVGRLRQNAKSYSVTELLDQTVRVLATDMGVDRPLTSWVREHRAFSVVFSSPEYFYTDAQLYYRAGFDRDIDLVRSIMHPVARLGAVDSEKGLVLPTSGSTKFPSKSIFRFVEDVHFAGRAFVWCADLGDEWADYVMVDGNEIAFAHCKHGTQTLGASSYQEVVGQALKNLGRVQTSPETFTEKIRRGKTRWGKSGIVRLRKGGGLAKFERAIQKVLSDPDAVRQVHLVISMLSLAEFDSKAKAVKKTPHFVQLVWLLAAFMSATREHGGRPVIVCAP